VILCPKIELRTFSFYKGIFKGGLWGRKPPTELWVKKAEGLKNRVGGVINYEFLDKAKIIKTSFIIH